MRPRSIVLDLCGDYIRYHGGSISLGGMTRLLGAFDITEDNVRVVMSRLRREGFFETRRSGRHTRYEITPATLQMLDEGRDRIFSRSKEPWDGNWHMVIYQVPESARASRERLRKELSWLGFGPLAASTWLSAHQRRTQVTTLFTAEAEARVDQLTARSQGIAEDRALAARCWDLGQLAADYEAWIGQWAGHADVPLDDRAALVTRIHLVYSYRKFPFSDPDLPAELLPDDWPGARAHELFLALYEALAGPAQRYYSHVAAGG
jgi:phenylacetic acid degradation operon negative regulatory protein